ncbi:Gfo/Idh/MocA family protein [Segetibacter aerophilus]|uniref:Dehydrogenase n=1 Tax=Segetibacter aerophilus TaxID=670293 RepID=A0A512BGZ5_9BACT|nr:Gfo/Idh/MocA family oxidoreductase [Segetibacter aerophilus]GEO11230.1 dehydrogenase [Segetibacter aerophilus]
MVKVGLIGAGKMGISHLSILGAHPEVEVVGVSDTSKMVLDVFRKYSRFPVFADYEEMLMQANPDAVFISVPTKLHSTMAQKVMQKGKHVFSEKPLCLTDEEGQRLVALAEEKKLINQVGYHNKFIGTFQEVKRIVDGGYLGEVFHFVGEAYGPVVVRPQKENWRSKPGEGGGCLLDYASHVIDLINHILGPVTKVHGTIMKSFYSKSVEDSVFSLLEISPKVSGMLSVNWSDDTYRKMSTSITIIGSKGKIICDANELKLYFKTRDCPETYTKGWNVKYVTNFTDNVNFYLRGEEYSAQVDYFIKAVQGQSPNNVNTFHSAWHTDRVISLIKNSVNRN